MRGEGIQKVHHFQNKEINEIAELSKSNEIDLQNYIYSPIGGHKVTPDNLNILKKEIADLAEKNSYPNVPGQKETQQFDIELTNYLINNLQISPNEASKNEVWNFLSCDLMPEIVHWRYFHKNETYSPTRDALYDRFLGGRRNCFQRLWWRAYGLRDLYEDNSDSMIFLKLLESDDIREFEERTTIVGNINLWREMVIQLVDTMENFKDNPSFKKRDLLRDCIKRVIRSTPWLSFETLLKDELKNAVSDIFSESLINLGLNPLIQKQTKTQKTVIENIAPIRKEKTEKLDQPEFIEDDVLINKKTFFISEFENTHKISILKDKKSKTMFASPHQDVRLAVFVSKRYERTNQKYWFSVTSQHREFLSQGEKSYILLGGIDKDYFFVLPFEWFLEREEYFNKSFFEGGDKIHLYIEDDYEVNSLILSKNEQRPMESIDGFKLPKEKSVAIKVISESDLLDPSIDIIRKAGSEGIDTTELIRQLRSRLKPEGKDLEILKGRVDDAFSQKVRNLKSHKRLEQTPNIRFIDNKFKWVEIVIISKRALTIPRDIDWKKEHFIKINKEKLPTTGGEKAKNQWALLKQFNKKSISQFQEKAMNATLNSSNFTYQSSNWWDREIDYCLQRRIISILDKKGKEVKQFH